MSWIKNAISKGNGRRRVLNGIKITLELNVVETKWKNKIAKMNFYNILRRKKMLALAC